MRNHIPDDPDDGHKPDPTLDWLERLGLAIRSCITRLSERVADPERLLHQMLLDMEDELEAVRHSVDRAVAGEIQLERELQSALKKIAERGEQAREALAAGDEEAALSRLEAKSAAEVRASELQHEFERYHDEVGELRASCQTLEDAIRQARQHRNVLAARLVRAEADRRIQNALDRIDGHSAVARFRRLEVKVARAEALGDATRRSPDDDAEVRERKQRLQRELAELQRRLDETP